MLAVFFRPLSMLAVALACAQQVDAQVFVNTPGNIPQGNPFNNSWTEQVDFADIDVDGDWDCGFADGDDCCNDQNRLWVNLAGVQGGPLGFFADVTAAQAPVILDQSRDIEFVDFDGDGDPDVHVSNLSELSNQPCHFWANQGGLQGGTAGFFVNETAARFVGLGGPGSSVPPSQVLGSGGYIAWAQDQDFADLDSDGDLDLVAATTGGAFAGQQPTRIFLNDGLGYFSEFNPSGFMLAGANIQNGNPALWCQGLQQAETTDTTGAFGDIATVATEVSLGDIDGDLDLDVLLLDRSVTPRMFHNRLELGALGFRDMTGTTWPQGHAVGNGTGKYEQDFGDFDGDGDLDIFGLNWSSLLQDSTLRGVGDGTFIEPTLAGPADPDDGSDLIDYDGDGDLDVYVAAFSGTEKLLANVFAGGPLVFSQVPNPVAGLPPPPPHAHDIDVADVDEDGDYDLMRATEGANNYLKNVVNVPDVSAPRLAHLEQPADHNSGLPTRIRVHVYDNAPDYRTAANATELHYWVDNGLQQSVPMTSSGAQVFRGELQASAVGNVRYQVVSTDEHGNTGVSALKAIDTGGGCSGQPATYCTPKLNSDGCLPRMEFEGAPEVGGVTNFVIRGTDVLANANGLLIYSKSGPNNAPFNGGVLCVGAGLLRTPGQNSGGAGPCGGTLSFNFNSWVALGSDPALVAGQKVWAQFWYRDVLSPGGNGLTNGVTFTLCP